MRAQALGEAVMHLPWLAPSAASLVALARPDSAAWPIIRTDPGAVLHLARFVPAAASVTSFSPALLRDPAVLQAALTFLDQAGSVDWDAPACRPIAQWSGACAELAGRLAERTGRVDVELARCAGLVAPLGWLGVCAIDPAAADSCFHDPAHSQQPAATQRRWWGIDAAALARRLARRWGLPGWLSAVVGHLALPVEIASGFGADPELFRIVQLAVALLENTGPCLGLPVLGGLSNLALWLGLTSEDLEQLQAAADTFSTQPKPPPQAEIARENSPTPSQHWLPPAKVPLLRELLVLAEENRRLADSPVLSRLESDLDELHRALACLKASEASRLQTLKLLSLAELAAGAGHEINNPLAVISGQAQYLSTIVAAGEWRVVCEDEPDHRAGHHPDPNPVPSSLAGAPVATAEGGEPHSEPETDPSRPSPPIASDSPDTDHLRQTAAALTTGLQAIIGQAQRIHEILNQMMQFARPSRPQKRLVDIIGLVRDAASSLAELAGQRHVRLVCPELDRPITLNADPRHLEMAVSCLLRNAIEAAPAEGWAGVRVTEPAPDRLEVLFEDSGPGPTREQVKHMFDPFYSGRQAGRGRGLGLPTAWRLAREHAGDVLFDDLSPGPTRFILRLPRDPGGEQAHSHGNGCAERNLTALVQPPDWAA